MMAVSKCLNGVHTEECVLCYVRRKGWAQRMEL